MSSAHGYVLSVAEEEALDNRCRILGIQRGSSHDNRKNEEMSFDNWCREIDLLRHTSALSDTSGRQRVRLRSLYHAPLLALMKEYSMRRGYVRRA